MQALEQEYGCQLCIGPCTTRGEVTSACLCLLFTPLQHYYSCLLLCILCSISCEIVCLVCGKSLNCCANAALADVSSGLLL